MADHNATVAQTLPSVTQSATGETDFFSAIGEATVTELLTASFSQDTTHTATLAEEIVYGEVRETTHVVNATNTIEYYSQVDVVGELTANETLPGAEWTTLLVPRGADIEGLATYTVTIPVDQVLTASDSQTYAYETTYTDQLTATNVAEPSGQPTVTVTSVVNVSNVVTTGQAETATAVLNAIDTFTPIVTQNETATGVVNASEVTAGTQHTFEDLLSTLTADEAITFNGSVANNVVSDTAYVKDSVWANDFGALAWVLSTETGGAFAYDNFGFDSIAEYNGVLYATSPMGIYELSGETDDGRDVSAQLKTGFLDFDQDQSKRLSDLYAGYIGGRLQVEVETYEGPQDVYTYDMEEREADAPRNNRIIVGKGLVSRYWRFTFKNVDGADFQIYDLSAVVGVSNRRL